MSFLIHEAAKAAKVHKDTVRRLEKLGLIKPERDHNGWRRYSLETVNKLKKLYAAEEEISLFSEKDLRRALKLLAQEPEKKATLGKRI